MTPTQKLISEATQYFVGGDYTLAETRCREVIERDKGCADAQHMLGAILSLKGDKYGAIEALRQATTLQASNSRYWITLGGNVALIGQFAEAVEYFLKATTLDPISVEAHFNLGLAYKHLGDLDEAARAFDHAIKLAPHHLGALTNLSMILVARRQFSDAELFLSKASLIAPFYAPAIATRAKIHSLCGRLDDAEALLNQAVSLDAGYHDAFFDLAYLYVWTNRTEMALTLIDELVNKNPSAVEIQIMRSMLLYSLNSYPAAAQAAQAVIQSNPKSAEGWKMLGLAAAKLGLHETSQSALTTSLELRPQISTQLLRDLALPTIMGSLADLSSSRATFEQRLDRLLTIEETERVNDPLAEIGYVNFYSAFHGKNDKNIQEKISQLYKKVCPSIAWVADHTRRPKQCSQSQSIRVGFYTRFTSVHSVSLSFGKMISSLSNEAGFNIVLISESDVMKGDLRQTFPDFSGETLRVPTALDIARAKIAALELDVLVYLDIGMDPFSYLLAHSRLAHIQCVMAGHPITTGIAEVDYFLSSALTEPERADEHYSERLVLLQKGVFGFERPIPKAGGKSRKLLGLPDGANIYFCPMMLQKLHPEFDQVVERILERDPIGLVVFVESPISTAWTEQVSARFDRSISRNLRARVKFIPWVEDPQDFMRVIAETSVILDSFHFGIGSTGGYVSAIGTPMVTLPGKFMRGRGGLGYCKLLDTMECVAESKEDYVNKAISIATDPALRNKIKAKILKNNHRLFENDGAAAELGTVLRSLLGR